MEVTFEREKHVYHSDVFDEIVKDAIRFFNGTPVLRLPPAEKFAGTGIYAIYYTGKNEMYNALFELNRVEFRFPIYVGKAVPSGWRQARDTLASSELYRRLKEHSKSIEDVGNLNTTDFYCRFAILEKNTATLIGTLEAALIRLYRPIWNTVLDGFGNHDPGSGRYNQAKSDWDVVHPGRVWAERCAGKPNDSATILDKIRNYTPNL